MLGIGSEKYWQGGGKYQQLFDELVNSLPPAGNSSTTAGEIVRAANKLMYDLYNNGMMNNTSSALLFLARKGVFPTAGGDKVFATIYPYSLGPSGNVSTIVIYVFASLVLHSYLMFILFAIHPHFIRI